MLQLLLNEKRPPIYHIIEQFPNTPKIGIASNFTLARSFTQTSSCLELLLDGTDSREDAFAITIISISLNIGQPLSILNIPILCTSFFLRIYDFGFSHTITSPYDYRV